MVLQTEQPLPELLIEREALLKQLSAVKYGSTGESPAHGHFKASLDHGREEFRCGVFHGSFEGRSHRVVPDGGYVDGGWVDWG